MPFARASPAPRPFKLLDLLLGPGMEFALGKALDAKRRVVLAPAVVDGEVKQDLQLLEHVIGCARRGRAPAHDLLYVLSCHLRNEPMADVFIAQQPLDHQLIRARGAMRKYPGLAK